MKSISWLPLLATLFCCQKNFAQTSPDIQWAKSFGGSMDDDGIAIDLTSDGGFILAGSTESTDGDVTGNHGLRDAWLVKLDHSGNAVWKMCYGGSNADEAFDVIQTSDHDYVFVGSTHSDDGDITGHIGGFDCWIVKIDTNHQIIWQKCLGGTEEDRANSVIQTSDGGYAFLGYTYSTNGDVSGLHGGSDIWMVRLDSHANIIWQKCLGGSSDEWSSSVRQTADGGYIISGRSGSNDGDVSGNHGSDDAWIAKLDSTGSIQWQKSYGGSLAEDDVYVIPAFNGGYMAAAISKSTDSDRTCNLGVDDYWILRLNNEGDLLWQKCFGGSDDDDDYYISPTSDNGYLLAGHTFSNDHDVVGYLGGGDYWLVKIDSLGKLLWQKCMGGTDGTLGDYGYVAKETSDGGAIIIGKSDSDDGEITDHHDLFDYWVVKLGPLTGVPDQPRANDFVSATLTNNLLQIHFEQMNPARLHADVFDFLGRQSDLTNEIEIKGSGFATLDVSQFTQGAYLLQLSDGVGAGCTKFVMVK